VYLPFVGNRKQCFLLSSIKRFYVILQEREREREREREKENHIKDIK